MSRWTGALNFIISFTNKAARRYKRRLRPCRRPTGFRSALARVCQPRSSVCRVHSHVSMNPDILYAKCTLPSLTSPKFCMHIPLARVYQPRNSVCEVHSHVSINPRGSVCKVHSHVSVNPEMLYAKYTRMCPVTAITLRARRLGTPRTTPGPPQFLRSLCTCWWVAPPPHHPRLHRTGNRTNRLPGVAPPYRICTASTMPPPAGGRTPGLPGLER